MLLDSKLHFILTMTEIGKLSQMPNIGLKCIKNSPDRKGCGLEQLHGGDKTAT